MSQSPAETKAVAAPQGRSLRDEMRVARSRQGRLALALGVVTAAGVAGVYVPAQRAIASAHAEVAEVDAQVAADSSRAVALPQVRTTVDDLQRQVNQYRAVRGAADIQQAIVEIGTIKADTSLQNYKFETNEVRALATCQEQRVRITFAADFVDAMSFVQRIEQMPRLIRVRELRVTGRKGDGGGGPTGGPGATNASTGRVGVEMALSLFYRMDER